MIPVSVIVMTRDEAANLAACLATLRAFAEVFVVDSGSTDGTLAIAAAAGARVVPFRWDGGYPKKKQWCLDHLPFTHDWVLYVDADERPTPRLVDEIASLMRHGPRHAGYFIDGRPVFLGRRLRFGAGTRKLALLHRHRAWFPPADDLDVATMWEVEGHYQPAVAGTVGRLAHPVLHADEKPLACWFDRHNRYSDWESVLRGQRRFAALTRHETKKRRRMKWIFDRLPLRPVFVFVYGYVVCLGFLDGLPGLHHALARAFYYWQVDVKMRDAAIRSLRPRPSHRPTP